MQFLNCDKRMSFFILDIFSFIRFYFFYFDFYRPQKKFAKVIFLHLSVILFTEGGGNLPQCMLGCTHTHTHPTQPPPGSEVDTPSCTRGRPPQICACWEIRATSGRYTSYWNAYLYMCNFGLL